MSGGMDQTISVFGQPLSSLHIQFQPELRSSAVSMQDNYGFVLCNSLTESLKAVSGFKHYNKRVFECRMGLSVVIRKAFPELTESQYLQKYNQIKTLWELQTDLKISLKELQELITKSFKESGVSGHEVSLPDILKHLNLDSVKQIFGENDLIQLVVDKNESFALEPRMLHVVQESLRVRDFVKALQEGSDPKELGKLMNDSHRSCAKLYDCSSANLDFLTQKSLEAGALGSRLTGAGWGGCYISLVPKSEVKIFLVLVNI